MELVERLVERARRLRRRGEGRKALITMREACMRADRAAWIWTLYGCWLAESGRASDAEQSLLHAVWLRKQAHEDGRERSTRLVLSRVRSAA